MFVLILVLSLIIEIPVLSASSEDPDQTPRFAASDLDLYCLPVSFLWYARHKWLICSIHIEASCYIPYASIRFIHMQLVSICLC